MLLLACGADLDGAPEPGEIDLLARAPDELFEHRGVLLPEGEQLWDPYGVSGWESQLSESEEGYAFVRSAQRTGGMESDHVADLPKGIASPGLGAPGGSS